MKNYTCHDCKENLKKGSECMPYTVGEKEFVKCKACYANDPVLRDFQEAEVYSRVVGFLRPTRQWNHGKKAEFGDRKEYQSTCEC